MLHRVLCGIYLRPILGHTPRKLPLRASPQSNLSLHRISSPIIIQHSFSNCNSFSKFFMTIFNEYSPLNLCIFHKFVRHFGILSPLPHSFSGFFDTLAGSARHLVGDFLCISMKIGKFIRDLFVLVTIYSQLSYIIKISIYVSEVPFHGSFAYMNAQGSKVKTYSLTAFILSIVGAIMYLLCYLLASDGSDYFISGHPLPLLANIFCIVSIVWFASALVLIPKGMLPESDFMLATAKPAPIAAAPIIGTMAAVAISFTYYEPDDLIGILSQQKAISTTTICAALTLIGAVLSILHYLLRMANSSRLNGTVAVLGVGPIALMTGLCGLTYFELDHHMNTPAKIGLQLAWIASMLFLISELRVTLEKSQPRRYLAVACIALFANACASVPLFSTIADIRNIVHGARIMGFSLFCLCNCLYVGCRLIQFTRHCLATISPDPDADPIPEQIHGKDDQNGCQQQDSMAS